MSTDAVQNKYQYGNYEFGKSNPFGQIRHISTRTGAVSSIDNQYGISIPENFALVGNEFGVGISQGLDGVGLAHVDAREHAFHAIC